MEIPDKLLWSLLFAAGVFAFLILYGVLWSLIGLWLMGRKAQKKVSSSSADDPPRG